MASTKFDLARQAVARIFTFGSSTAGGDGLVTIEKGTAPVTQVGLDVKNSAHIGGDAAVDGNMTVLGNLVVAGTIDRQNVTDSAIKDKTVILNAGGTTAGATDVGLKVEGDGGSIIARLLYGAGKWFAGDTSVAANEITTIGANQSLSNKTLVAPTITGTASVPTQAPGTSNTTPASTGFVSAAIAAIAMAYTRGIAVSGTQDGNNKTFTLATAPVAGTEQIYINGQLLMPGSTNDYVIAGATVTFQAAFTAPSATDVLRAYGVF